MNRIIYKMYPLKSAPPVLIRKTNPVPRACKDCKYVNKKLLQGIGLFSCNLLSEKLETALLPTTLARIEPYLCGPDARFFEKLNMNEFEFPDM